MAAGVMLYVSLVEIFVKSQGAFANHGYSEVRALGRMCTWSVVSLGRWFCHVGKIKCSST